MSEVINAPASAEAKPEVAAEVKAAPQDGDLKVKLEEFAKQQKELLRQKAYMKSEKSRLAKEKAEIDAFRAKRESEERERTQRMSPIEALQAAGYSYEDATQFVLNNNQITPDVMYKKVDSKIENFIQEQKKLQEQQAEQHKLSQEKQMVQVVEDFKESIKETVTTNQEKYELINMNEAYEDVYELIDVYYKETGKVMKIEEAADLIEEELQERIEKSLSSKKLASKYTKAEVKEATEAAQKESKTLSNSLTVSTSSPYLPAKTEADRIQRALAALGK